MDKAAWGLLKFVGTVWVIGEARLEWPIMIGLWATIISLFISPQLAAIAIVATVLFCLLWVAVRYWTVTLGLLLGFTMFILLVIGLGVAVSKG